jgi:DNA-nicking Smr family endonuclease
MAGRVATPDTPPPAPAKTVTARPAKVPPAAPLRPAAPIARAAAIANSLDGGWDRRLARGVVMPDSTLDLHGHTLRSAHALLDAGIERAVARGDRVLLLVTGKPPRAESERPHARGAIRAQVADWIAQSRHAGRIAAVRGAHPRHGGQGALYVIFRRPRTAP